MNDNVEAALSARMLAGDWSNPALSALLRDYTLYHLILVLSASGAVAVSTALTVLFVRRWLRERRAQSAGSRFARRTYLGFALIGAAVAVVAGMLAVIDLSNVVDARQGFALSVDALPTPTPDSHLAPLYTAFTSWVQSGSSTVPVQVQQSVQARMDWQGPKAVVSAVLLALSLAMSVVLWRTLLHRAARRPITWHLRDGALLVPGVAGVALAHPLLVLVLVLANLQAAVAPLAMTLSFG